MPRMESVLVTGATGTQGGAVVRALLASHIPVRALVRSEEKGQQLARLGATLAIGSFEDPASLYAAAQGAAAVFSMQNAPLADPDSERREARHLLEASQAAGVGQIVHSSVSGSGAFHRTMPGWSEGRWSANYWESKADVEDMIRSAGFACWTILRPAFMMENFVAPKAKFMFPDLVNDKIVTALRPASRMVLVSADDIGRATVAAMLEPRRFNTAEIELAGDMLTMSEIANVLSGAQGRTITAQSVSADEAVARGQFPGWVNSQQWSDEVGYPARPEDARAFGLEPTNFRDWARRLVTPG